jgi:hypothetical protein
MPKFRQAKEPPSSPVSLFAPPKVPPTMTMALFKTAKTAFTLEMPLTDGRSDSSEWR